MAIRYYNPVIHGPGITILEKPSDPNHGVRLQDMQQYATMQIVEFENETFLSIQKRTNVDNYIVQIYDESSSLIFANKVSQQGANIEISFTEEQSGRVLIFSIGGM